MAQDLPDETVEATLTWLQELEEEDLDVLTDVSTDRGSSEGGKRSREQQREEQHDHEHVATSAASTPPTPRINIPPIIQGVRLPPSLVSADTANRIEEIRVTLSDPATSRRSLAWASLSTALASAEREARASWAAADMPVALLTFTPSLRLFKLALRFMAMASPMADDEVLWLG